MGIMGMAQKARHAPIEKHKYYDLAYRAHSGTSFVPEKRALSQCEYYDAVCQEFRDSGKEWAIEKFSKLFEKSLYAKSRCVSFVIAGPANFPAERIQKYNEREHKATSALIDFVEKVRRPSPKSRTELDYGIRAAEFKIGEVSVKYCTDQNRIQLFFDGRPEKDRIEKLKKNGFKWSPRNAAWQRQLTTNAIKALRDIFPDMDYAAAIAKARG